MKKIILSALAVCAFTFVSAQDKKASSDFGYAKGDFVLGGNIKYTSVDNDGVKSSSSEFGPEAAYFLSDKFAVTAGIMIGSTDNLPTDPGVKRSTSNIAIGGRYYILDLGQRFKTYTNFGLNFGSDDNGGDGAEKTSTLGLGAGVGMNYFITTSIAINFGLANVISYGSSKTGDAKATGMDVNLNEFSNFFAKPTFGVAYKF
jgi:outer membrane protein